VRLARTAGDVADIPRIASGEPREVAEGEALPAPGLLLPLLLLQKHKSGVHVCLSLPLNGVTVMWHDFSCCCHLCGDSFLSELTSSSTTAGHRGHDRAAAQLAVCW
jgi:hypothetical protein